MKLIEQHGCDAFECWIIEDHAGEDAFGDHLDTCRAPNLRSQACAKTNRCTNPFTQRLGHTLCGRARGNPARLQHEDTTITPPGRIEQGQRHARCLAGTGRRHQHRIGRADKRCRQRPQHRFDRQGCFRLHQRVVAESRTRGSPVRIKKSVERIGSAEPHQGVDPRRRETQGRVAMGSAVDTLHRSFH